VGSRGADWAARAPRLRGKLTDRRRPGRRTTVFRVTAAASSAALLGMLGVAGTASAASGSAVKPADPKTPATAATLADDSSSTCHLGNGIQHVVQVTFDNVHFFRDNPNVPSDLEMLPNLLNFIEDNGTMLSSNHTPLIAHTADDILTTYTGLYGDRQGMPVCYKQLNSSVGQFANYTLQADTKAIESTSPGDVLYHNTDRALASLDKIRDALALRIKAQLEAAAFENQPIFAAGAEAFACQAVINSAAVLAHSA
jgi:hypothetical protein